jgi:hypothetical protein
MELEEYFATQEIVNKKRYDALHDFIVCKHSAEEVAHKYGYCIIPVFISAGFQEMATNRKERRFLFQRYPFGS